jgi:hypothetical protein
MIIRTITNEKTGDVEKDSLEAHVEICRHRYDTIDKKITTIEKTLDEIEVHSDNHKNLIIKAISAAAAVISVVLSATIFLIEKLH